MKFKIIKKFFYKYSDYSIIYNIMIKNINTKRCNKLPIKKRLIYNNKHLKTRSIKKYLNFNKLRESDLVFLSGVLFNIDTFSKYFIKRSKKYFPSTEILAKLFIKFIDNKQLDPNPELFKQYQCDYRYEIINDYMENMYGENYRFDKCVNPTRFIMSILLRLNPLTILYLSRKLIIK